MRLAVAVVTHHSSTCEHASAPWKERNEVELLRSELEADMKSCVAGIDFALGVQMCVGEGVLTRIDLEVYFGGADILHSFTAFVEGSDGRFVCRFG